MFDIVWCLLAKKLKLLTERGRGVDAQGHDLVDVDIESTDPCILIIQRQKPA
jgi:hypothetical protein